MFVDKQILGLEVSMDDSSGMTVIDSVYQLKHEVLHMEWSYGRFIGVYILLQVMLGILEDQVQLLLARLVAHIEQADSETGTSRCLDGFATTLAVISLAWLSRAFLRPPGLA